jgi:hypothetical protein
MKQIELEGTNVIVLQYPEESAVKDVLLATNKLQDSVGQSKQVVAMPDKVSIHCFDFQGFVEHLEKVFNVQIMWRNKRNDKDLR